MRNQNTLSDKVTLKLDKGRLATWPGNCTRWIKTSPSGDAVVDGVPGQGHVIATRLQPTTALRVIGALPQNIANVLRQGMPVVLKRAEVPEFVNVLI